MSYTPLKHYILVGQTPIEVSLFEWAAWFDSPERIIAKTTVRARDQNYSISTVFLGIDHDFSGKGLPILFETMVFTDDKAWENYAKRWRSYLEAKKGHRMIEIQVGSQAKP